MFKLGVDIDGVLNDFHTLGREILWEQYGIKADPTRYSLWDYTPDSQREEFFAQYHAASAREKPVAAAAGVLSTLRRQRVEIWLITARTEAERYRTTRWLRTNGIVYDRLIFDADTKAATCVTNNIDLMIDDAPKNLEALHDAGVPTLRFQHSYNTAIPGVKTVRNWYEILSDVLERLPKDM